MAKRSSSCGAAGTSVPALDPPPGVLGFGDWGLGIGDLGLRFGD
jgi:hypothetical protein